MANIVGRISAAHPPNCRMSRFGEQLDLPLEGDGETTCPHTGEVYILKDGQVFCGDIGYDSKKD